MACISRKRAWRACFRNNPIEPSNGQKLVHGAGPNSVICQSLTKGEPVTSSLSTSSHCSSVELKGLPSTGNLEKLQEWQEQQQQLQRRFVKNFAATLEVSNKTWSNLILLSMFSSNTSPFPSGHATDEFSLSAEVRLWTTPVTSRHITTLWLAGSNSARFSYFSVLQTKWHYDSGTTK